MFAAPQVHAVLLKHLPVVVVVVLICASSVQ